MKLLAINGSPRKTWNTARLLGQVALGASAAGAETDLVHLRDLLPYKGCISCFHCKDPNSKHYGRCVIRDDLTPLLDKAHEADVLVLGSPVYFSGETGLMRNFMERLWFQYHLYSTTKPPLSPRKRATALVYTMNVKESEIPTYGYERLFAASAKVMEREFGSCEVFLCTDTYQVIDYAKYGIDRFDPEDKLRRHQEVFPEDLKRACALGGRLVG